MADLTDTFTHLYENGAKPADIAAAFPGMTEAEVCTILMEQSPKFRAENRRATNPNMPVADEMLEIIADRARTSKNDFVVLAAAKYVRDDLKGRRDALPATEEQADKVLGFIAERFKQLEEKRARFKNGLLNTRPVIEAEEVKRA